MRNGRQKNSVRVLKETSNLPAPLVPVVIGVAVAFGVMTTVVTTKTVLLASCLVVLDEELTTVGVVDETVDVVVLDVLGV